MIIVGILQSLLYLFIIPFFIGLVFTKRFDKKHKTLGNILTCGVLSELAVFQLLFLCFYFADSTLTKLTVCTSIVLVILALVGAITSSKEIKEIKLPKLSVGFGVFSFITAYMLVMRNLNGVNDGDDAYVLGTALTTLTNDKFFKVDYYTGFQISSESYLRHLLASSPFFISYLSKLTFIHPTVFAHRILGSYYIFIHNIIIYNIGILLFDTKEREKYVDLFASLVAFITIWDFHSYLCDSTFILSRSWQGKSMFCSIAIPFAILILLMLGKDEKKKYIYMILSGVLAISSVAMTPGSIFVYPLYMFAGGICVAFAKKKFYPALFRMLSLIPLIGFAYLYLRIRG